MRILVTCPPMLGMIDSFNPLFEKYGVEVTAPEVIQTLSVEELKELVPQHDGWIIGDDPATREVFQAGRLGRLKAAVKWGIGIDNVDFSACKDLAIPIINTPDMFGSEVADIAMGYVIALARETFQIDRYIRDGHWPKPKGISLMGKTVALLGYGDVGKNVAKRMLSSGMKVVAYDPYVISDNQISAVEHEKWPKRIDEADFIVITCSLTESSRHMINEKLLKKVKSGVRIVNVGRGPIIDETALESALISEKVYSAALDVFEIEPLPMHSYLRNHARCILGSHNASNTSDAVIRTSQIAIDRIMGFLSE
ncbi:phosphoglycerate dehydrogenase [Amylibacter sp.]|nr:phosphoglycerate dehydrogenase [Amylibacter sp.]